MRIHSNPGIAEHDSDYFDTPPVRVHLNSDNAENDSLNSTRYDAQPVRTYSNSNSSEHASSNNDLRSKTWRTSAPRHVQFSKSDTLENSPEVPPFTTPQQGTCLVASETIGNPRQDFVPELSLDGDLHTVFSENRCARSAPLTVNPRLESFRANRVPKKAKEPDLYDGKSTDFKDYIVHFEQVANWNAWDKSEMAQQLCMSLRGNAQKLLSDLNAKQITQYSDIKSALEQRFHPPGQESAFRSEFRNRRRDKNESVTDYGYALCRLGCLAFPDTPYDAKEIYIIDQFIHGLGSQELKKHVKFKHPKTLDQAVSLAVEFESFAGSQSTLNKPPPVSAVQKGGHPDNKLDCEGMINKQITEGFKSVSESLPISQDARANQKASLINPSQSAYF